MCPPVKTWYVEARVGSENHRGECVRYIDDRRGIDGHYDNHPVENVIAELRAALASRDAELATLREGLEVLRAGRKTLATGFAEACTARDAALFEVARLTRERDEAREWAHSFAERAAKDRDEALLQHALESGRRVAAEAERDEAQCALAGRGMSCTPDLDWVRLKAERDEALAKRDEARGRALEEAAVVAMTLADSTACHPAARRALDVLCSRVRALAAKGGA